MLNNSILKSIIELENLHWAWEKAKDFYNDDNYWCDELEIIDFIRKNDVFQRSSHSTVIISLETKRIIEKTEVQLLLLSLKLTCILF